MCRIDRAGARGWLFRRQADALGFLQHAARTGGGPAQAITVSADRVSSHAGWAMRDNEVPVKTAAGQRRSRSAS